MNPLETSEFSNKEASYPNISDSQMKDPQEFLPSEIFQKVISYLKEVDKRSARLMSRGWNAAIIEQSKHEECARLRFFVDCRVRRLNQEEYSREISEIQVLMEETAKKL